MKPTALLLALYFLLGSFMPGADYGQLSKWAEALEHYQIHQQLAEQQEETLSFHQFLLAHFWNTDGHDHGDNGKSHQDLPLKHLQSFHHIAFQFYQPTLQLPLLEQIQMISAIAPYSGATYLSAVFRPPII